LKLISNHQKNKIKKFEYCFKIKENNKKQKKTHETRAGGQQQQQGVHWSNSHVLEECNLGRQKRIIHVLREFFFFC